MFDQGKKNLFPQNSNLNRGAYKKIENEWADWSNEGFEVKLEVELHPFGVERPTNIISEYEVPVMLFPKGSMSLIMLPSNL